MLAAFVFLISAPPTLVLVDSKLGARCVQSDARFLIAEANGPLDLELDKQRKWIAEAKEALKKGRELELELESEGAEHKLEEALVLFGRAAPALDDFSDYARTLIDLGAVFTEARKDAEAGQAFRRAIVLEVSAHPDAKEYPPEVIKRFRKAVAEAARQPRSSLAVSGTPMGATLYWDGHLVGQIPVSISDAMPGDHWLTALAPGHKRFSTLVTIHERAQHVEVFMREVDASTTREQLAIASAEHADSPTVRELGALANLGKERSVIVLARDAHAPNDPSCAAQYRVYSAASGASPLAAVTLPPPFDLNQLSLHPAAQVSVAPIGLQLPVQRVNPFVSLLPLGAGQFVERRPGAGAALLVSQLALVAANVTCYLVAQSNRVPNGSYNNAEQVRDLAIATDIAAGALIVDVIAGAIDGIVHR